METTEHSVLTPSVQPPTETPNKRSTPVKMGFHCTTTREDILPSLSLVQAIAEKRSSLPILTQVYVEARPEGRLALRATDLELGLSRQCPATVKTTGACTADARRLYEIIRALPPGALVLDANATHGLTVSQGKSRFRLPSLDPKEFPHLAPPASQHVIHLPATTLQEMMSKTLFAVSPDETRVELSAVLLEPGEGECLRLVASDGHRLACIERPVPGLPGGLPSVLLPKKGMAEARRLLELGKDDEATLSLAKAVATLAVASTTLSLRLVDGQFPDYRQVIPTQHAHRLSFPRVELASAVRRLLVLTTEQARGVLLKAESGKVELSVHAFDLGEGTEELLIDYEGPGITVAFNGRYLADVLGVLDTAERLILELTDATKPGVVRAEGDEGYCSVIMPMRVD